MKPGWSTKAQNFKITPNLSEEFQVMWDGFKKNGGKKLKK
jgi:hypothetical protein